MPPATVHLVQFTDTHLVGDPARRLRGLDTFASLQAVIAAAASDLRQADALLLTGDLVNDDAAGYARLRELLQPLDKPALCLPGNHDDGPALAAALSTPPFHSGGSHDLGAWRVVLLDSTLPQRTEGALSEAELKRLEAALAGAGARPVLVVLHHPPVPLGSHWLDEVGVTNAAEFWTVIDRHPQVRAVLFGHAHQAYDGNHHGVRVLGTPSTCFQFQPGVDDFRIDPAPPGWRCLALQPDGTLHTRLSRLES